MILKQRNMRDISLNVKEKTHADIVPQPPVFWNAKHPEKATSHHRIYWVDMWGVPHEEDVFGGFTMEAERWI